MLPDTTCGCLEPVECIEWSSRYWMTDHLDWLEDEGIDREACAGAANPVLMYSIGKDSSVRTSGRSFPKSRSL